MVPASRDAGHWRKYAAAGIAPLWVIGSVGALAVLYWWGFCQSPEPSADHQNPKTHCQYTYAAQNSAAGAVPRVVSATCLYSDAGIGAEEAKNGEDEPPKAAVPLSQYVARKVVSDPITLFTLVLALFTWRLIKVGRDQHEAAMGALNLARDEFNSTHRPRLRVRNIFLGGPQPFQSSAFSHGNLVSGQFYVANIGDMPAHIVESHCEFLWNVNSLPMKRPYEGLDGNNPLLLQTIAAGSSATATFQSYDTYPLHGTPGTAAGPHIYLLGWIEYLDDRKVRRRTAFCRRFLHRHGSARFYPVNDPDYEYEE